MKKKTCSNWKISDRARIASTRSTAGTVDQGFAAARSDSTRMVYSKRQYMRTGIRRRGQRINFAAAPTMAATSRRLARRMYIGF
jgi:hypothetical protein